MICLFTRTKGKMMRSLFFILLIKVVVSLTPEEVRSFASSVPEGGKLWALLVAGSNTWDNYRHQADVCHAYQVLHNHGIPDEQIVVMMYNDIAHNSFNPTPGVIINHPHGPNVYKGVPLDYTKDDVLPKNFFNILWGNETALKNVGSGKVIKSNPNDHVFVYFSDHGAYGFICFPGFVSENDYDNGDITNDQLISFLKDYYAAKKYSKMVLYIEACESGSMFIDLPKDINVFATTAANKDESSSSCYYDEKLYTYLGDVYSVNWMEDSDKEVLSKESLEKQFRIVKQETNTSHVKQFGDLTISKMPVSEFQGRKQAKPITYPKVPFDAVPSNEVPVEILKRKIERTNSIREKHELKKQLYKLLKNRRFADNVVKEIVWYLSFGDEDTYNRMHLRPNGIKNNCYYEAVRYFRKQCFNYNKNEYLLRHLYKLANICNEGVPLSKIEEAMDVVCTHPPVCGIK
ncbi:legumain-like isoform X2 [Centruroides sculpturatus]|uniref:legumain-like isoform X2 n=1 Tax=Centruroides sculpturatus TaxID=218467 RepID=UPI000C6D50A8|nr:legumain-like isoform X2 [Centruroides sculpturatus]